jgi:hypothetical protein
MRWRRFLPGGDRRGERCASDEMLGVGGDGLKGGVASGPTQPRARLQGGGCRLIGIAPLLLSGELVNARISLARP